MISPKLQNDTSRIILQIGVKNKNCVGGKKLTIAVNGRKMNTKRKHQHVSVSDRDRQSE